jgi:cell division protein FtsQ
MQPLFVPEQPQFRPRPHRRVHVRATTMVPVLVAALTGALLFAGLSGFGRDARIAKPIHQQLDGLLVKAGLTINEVTVSGHRLTLDSDVYAALRLENEGSLVLFDVAAARRRIENIPWVAEAHVARMFPDKLRIHIRERVPAAVWREAGARTLLDATGRQLARIAPNAASSLPVVTGAGAPAAVGELLKALDQHPDLAARLDVASRIGQRRWSLALADGIVIHLPETGVAAAVERLADLERRQKIASTPGQVVDLRRLGQVAVGESRRRHAAEELAPQRHLRAAAE